MRMVSIQEGPGAGGEGFSARPFIEGDHSNVRLIHIAPGAALPPHRHGASDLMLYAAEGEGTLEIPEGSVPFPAGSLACYQGDEELRVRNSSSAPLILLAFLAPKFATS